MEGMEAFIESMAACRIIRVLDWPGIARVAWHISTLKRKSHLMTLCMQYSIGSGSEGGEVDDKGGASEPCHARGHQPGAVGAHRRPVAKNGSN